MLAQLDSVVKYVLLAMQSSLKTSHKHNTGNSFLYLFELQVDMVSYIIIRLHCVLCVDEIRPVEHLSTSLVAEFEDVRIHKVSLMFFPHQSSSFYSNLSYVSLDLHGWLRV